MKVKGLVESLRKEKGKQVVFLLFSNVLALPVGILTTVLLSKALGKDFFGDYSFLINVFTLAIVLFSLGFFHATGRAVVLSSDRKEISEFYGGGITYLLISYTIMSVLLLLYAFIDGNLHYKGLFFVFLKLIPLGFVFLFSNFFETVFQADNKIKELSISRLLPRIIFLLACTSLIKFGANQIGAFKYALIFYFSSQIVSIIYIVFRLSISFKNLKRRIAQIWSYNKSFGFHLYFGALFSLGAGQLAGILISYFSKDNTYVGFYNLATSFAAPLTIVPNTIATTHYKDFVGVASIPKKLTFYALLSTVFVFALLLICIPFFILKFYGPNFTEVTKLVYILSFGAILYGFGDYINRFLGANGKGKSLRNTAIIVGISLLLFNAIFIPLMGAYGASITYVCGGAVYFLCMMRYYWVYKRSM